MELEAVEGKPSRVVDCTCPHCGVSEGGHRGCEKSLSAGPCPMEISLHVNRKPDKPLLMETTEETKAPMAPLKRLWTSYYARARDLPPDLVQVRISRSAPGWWKPARKDHVPDLAPNDYTWASPEGDDMEWRRRYQLQLSDLFDSGRLRAIVDNLAEGSVLLCYERPVTACHRGELAEFLNTRGLAVVSEYLLPPTASQTRMKKGSSDVTDQGVAGGVRQVRAPKQSFLLL